MSDEHSFEIPVVYKNQELAIPARLQLLGYTYRIVAVIGGVELYFERDDSGAFRAVLANESTGTTSVPDTALLQAMAIALNELFA